MGREQFSGEVKVRWVEDDPRDMVILEDFSFVDSKGRRWIAMEGARINGASIPPILWSVIGSPFIGYYRRASVLHDTYYDNHLRPKTEVDLMFEEAMIADGVPKLEAHAMYIAVRDFSGGHW